MDVMFETIKICYGTSGTCTTCIVEGWKLGTANPPL